MLKKTFYDLVSNYIMDTIHIDRLWTELESAYSNKKRHYHNLTHLENLLIQLTEIKSKIMDFNTILFSMFYHDIVYNTLKSDNEEKSAELAEKKLTEIFFPIEKIKLCTSQILATKSHIISENNDTNMFTDADLSILGSEWETYNSYSQQIRKEYSIYPDILYNLGRKKVLNHFLRMKTIFKTDYFHAKYEIQARKNLKMELRLL